MSKTPIYHTYLHMHWGSRNQFSACYTHRQECTYIRASTSVRRCSKFFAMETIANYPRILKVHSNWQSKAILLNHNDTLPEQNIQRRHAGSTPRLTAQPPHLTRFSTSVLAYCVPSFYSRTYQHEFTPAHDAVAVALSHRHHLIIHVGAGPHPISQWRALTVRHGCDPSQISYLALLLSET